MKILYITLSILFALILSSCDDYLDIVPDDSPTLDIVFENRVNALEYLATCYSYLPSYSDPSKNPALFSGDELWVNSIAQKIDLKNNFPGLEVAQGRISEGNTKFSAMRLYVGIRDCNTFLNYYQKPYDMEQEEKDQWGAEVRVLKAYYHFCLFRMYGPIVILKNNYPVDSEELPERETVDEVVNYIVSLIDESMEYLSNSALEGFIEEGRIDKVVAATIKAKTLVLAASPLFNGNKDYLSFKNSAGVEFINSTFSKEKWAKAKKACEQAVALAEAAGNTLYTFPSDNVKGKDITVPTKTKLSIRGSVTETENNTEIIWRATGRLMGGQHRYQARIEIPKVNNFNSGAIEQFYSVPLRIVEQFYSKNGVPINEDQTYNYSSRFELKEASPQSYLDIKTGYKTVKLHFNREPRFYASIGFDGGTWYGNGVFDENSQIVCEAKGGQMAGYTGDPTDNHWSATGYYPKKMVNFQSQVSRTRKRFDQVKYSWPIFRLADIYLMYAEALNEAEAPFSDVYIWMNKVRNRAGLPGVQEAWSSYSITPDRIKNRDELRKIIHQERLIESVFEGQRFWDLRRWKRAEEFINNKAIKGWNIFSGSTEGFYTINEIFQQNFTQKNYLWPIPLNDLLANPNLVQNPGW